MSISILSRAERRTGKIVGLCECTMLLDESNLIVHSLNNRSCAYLAEKFCQVNDEALSKHAICLCDDDNDLEMALACSHAYIPDVSSDSMAEMIRKHPDQLTVTGGPGRELEGTHATEKALELVLERISLQNKS